MDKSKILIIAGITIVTLSIGFYFGLFSPKKARIANENNSEFIQIDALAKVIQEKDREKKKAEPPKEEPPKKEIKKVFKPVAFDKETCDKLKGEWGQRPFDQKYICNIPTSDSGKKCLDEAECQGSCLAEFKKDESGIDTLFKSKCSAWTIVLGCNYYMQDGNPVHICRD